MTKKKRDMEKEVEAGDTAPTNNLWKKGQFYPQGLEGSQHGCQESLRECLCTWRLWHMAGFSFLPNQSSLELSILRENVIKSFG